TKPLPWVPPPHPEGGSASTKGRICLRGGRKATGLSCPPLDAAPAPDRRPPKLPDRLGKSGSGCEDVHALRRNAEALRDVNGDHELRPRIDLHCFERYPGLRRSGRDAVIRVPWRSGTAPPQAKELMRCQAQPKSAPVCAVEKCTTWSRVRLISAAQAEPRSGGA